MSAPGNPESGEASVPFAAVRLAVGTFTILPVPAPGEPDARTAGRAMALAPLVGLALGAAAGGCAWIADLVAGPFVGAVAAVAALAILTRALHLDGLADTADGMGSGRQGPDGVAVMRRSDIGPFGVITVVLVLLADIALITHCLTTTDALTTLAVLAVAGSTGRCGVTWCVRRGARPASKTGLGATVIGTVPRTTALVVVALMLLVALALLGAAGAAAVAGGLVAAMLVARSTRRRFDGLTGDTLGAVVELGTLAALLGAVSVTA
jgi:adenosylcobinamide-GDP ribazoletransferase